MCALCQASRVPLRRSSLVKRTSRPPRDSGKPTRRAVRHLQDVAAAQEPQLELRLRGGSWTSPSPLRRKGADRCPPVKPLRGFPSLRSVTGGRRPAKALRRRDGEVTAKPVDGMDGHPAPGTATSRPVRVEALRSNQSRMNLLEPRQERFRCMTPVRRLIQTVMPRPGAGARRRADPRARAERSRWRRASRRRPRTGDRTPHA